MTLAMGPAAGVHSALSTPVGRKRPLTPVALLLIVLTLAFLAGWLGRRLVTAAARGVERLARAAAAVALAVLLAPVALLLLATIAAGTVVFVVAETLRAVDSGILAAVASLSAPTSVGRPRLA
jgi:hypothetical protein